MLPKDFSSLCFPKLTRRSTPKCNNVGSLLIVKIFWPQWPHSNSTLLYIKQGCALNNWVEDLSDEATPESHQKKFDLNLSTQQMLPNKTSFDSSIRANLWVFQNHRKKAKINIVVHCFPSLGLNKPPWFWIFKVRQL